MRATMKTALAAALLLAALPAIAQPTPPKPEGRGTEGREAGRGMAAMFDRIDGDHDGKVTMREAWSFVETRFAAADADRDGGLTTAEMMALRPDGGRPGSERGRERGSERGPEREGGWGGAMFRGLDANGDQKVQLDELRPMVEARFRSLDANRDNVVAKDELPQRHGHDHHGQRPAVPSR